MSIISELLERSSRTLTYLITRKDLQKEIKAHKCLFAYSVTVK